MEDVEVGWTSDEVGEDVVTGISDVVALSLVEDVGGVETDVVVAVGVPVSEVTDSVPVDCALTSVS